MRKRDLKDKSGVEAAVRQVADEYLRDPNVNSVGVGYKIADGKPTETLALQFSVGRKFAPEALEAVETRPIPEFPDAQERLMSDCGRSEAPGFEPAAGKGPVARATLYFLLRYLGQIGDEARELQRERVGLLLDWHRGNPVEEYERHRNAAIAELQGNRNPLIDHPQWAERIDFEASVVG
jgi:hypothetical protein